MNKQSQRRQAKDNSHLDPVCRMRLSQETATDKIDFGGERFYFCSPTCRFEFELDPNKYMSTN